MSAPRSLLPHDRLRLRSADLSAVPALGGVDAHALVDDALPRPRRQLRRQLLGLPGLLLSVDVAALAVAGVLSRPALWSALTFAVLLLIVRSAQRAYRPRITASALDDLPRSLVSALAALGLTLAAEAAVGGPPQDARAVLADGLVLFGVSWLLAILLTAVVRSRRRRRGPRDRTLLVGTGTVGRLLVEALAANPQLGLLPVGFVGQDADHYLDLDQPARSYRTAPPLPAPVLAERLDDLGATIARHNISTVVLAFAAMPGSAEVDAIIAAHQRGASVLVVPHVLDLHADGPDVERVHGVPLVRMRPDPTLRPSWWLKRAVDVLIATLGLLLLLPLLLLLAAAVLLDSGRPVLFWQQRVGLDGRSFRLCKFRSMRPVPDTVSQTTWADASRIGRLGSFLRSSSLDEIPQLWNVLRGDMSLVGPRPERPTFVARFSGEHERYWARHRVPVGLTGLAQVNGLRGDTSIADRARYDNYYIANWSPWLDIKIIVLTFRAVLRGSGG